MPKNRNEQPLGHFKETMVDHREAAQFPETAFDEAKSIVYGDREAVYGDPAHNLSRIAELWSSYLQRHLRDWLRHNWVNIADVIRHSGIQAPWEDSPLFEQMLRNLTQSGERSLALDARDTCHMMQLLKWARDENQQKHDNVVDDLGYGGLVARVREQRFSSANPSPADTQGGGVTGTGSPVAPQSPQQPSRKPPIRKGKR